MKGINKNKLSMLRKVYLLGLMVIALGTTAQTTSENTGGVTESQAQKALDSTGVTQEQIKTHLKGKGIDLDNLTPEQAATVESEIQQAILEIQAAQGAPSGAEDSGVVEIKTIDSPPVQEVVKEVEPKKEEVSDDEKKRRHRETLRRRRLNETSQLYGFDIFFNHNIEFYNRVEEGRVPDSYVLDAGDKIAINIFGQSQADLLYEIEEDGFIRPTGMYKIYLRGLSIAQAKSLLRARFSQRYVYQNDQFNVSLNSGRVIKVNIFGEVYEPGSFTISAYNNVLNAITGAGGPKPSASLRKIRVVSGGKERIIDVYDYLVNPTGVKDLSLKEGDLIYIERSDRRVQLKGKATVLEYTEFDLLPNENLKSLLDIVKLRNDIKISNVQVSYFEGDERKLKDYSIEDVKQNDVALSHGDVVVVSGYAIKARNFYSISGSVLRPGNYELVEGTMLSDAIKKAGFREETFGDLAYLTRVKPDGNFQVIRLDVKALNEGNSDADLALQSRDRIQFLSTRSFVDSYELSISGAVRNPGTYEVSKQVTYTLYDLIMLSSGLRETATDFGYVVRTDINNPSNTTYEILDIKTASNNPLSAANVALLPNDKIVIPDVKTYTDEFQISIEGAVRKPGSFKYDKALSLKEVILMAGGLKFEAASNRIDVYRLKVTENEPTLTLAESVAIDRNYEPLNMGEDFELQPFDKIVVRNAPEYEQIRYVTVTGEVRYPGKYAILKDNERISDIVARADGLTREAFPEAGTISRSTNGVSGIVVTRIDKAIRGRRRHDIVVKEGDQIVIPKTSDVVTIDRVGTRIVTEIEAREGVAEASTEQINVQINYKPRRAKWYINSYAGGFSKDARRSATKVLYPNGQVRSTVNLGIVKVYPKVRRGSKIFLELKEVKEKGDSMGIDERLANIRERMERIVEATTTIMTLTTSTITTILLIDRL